MNKRGKYGNLWQNKQRLAEAIDGAISVSEVLRRLDVNISSRTTLVVWAKKHDLALPKDARSVMATAANDKLEAESLDEIFTAGNHLRSGQRLRRLLVRYFAVPDICAIPDCGQAPSYLGKELVLQLDHIDGNRFNNERSNLRILCPNCHTQTETYANKGGQERYGYCSCGERKLLESVTCRTCANRRTSQERAEKNSQAGSDASTKGKYPPIVELIESLRIKGYRVLAEELGVSGNAIRNYIRRRGYDPKEFSAWNWRTTQ